MISNSLLPQTFTRRVNTPASDGMGGFDDSWADSTTFQGRLSVLPVSEKMGADAVTVYATHRLYCNNLTITEKDRVTYGSRTFEIKGIRNPSNLSEHLEIDLLETE